MRFLSFAVFLTSVGFAAGLVYLEITPPLVRVFFLLGAVMVAYLQGRDSVDPDPTRRE